MKLTGEYAFDASSGALWDALSDPDVLRESLPNCTRLQRSNKDGKTVMTQDIAPIKLGPLKVAFNVLTRISEERSQETFVLAVEAFGGQSGPVKGEATISVTPAGNASVLSYDGTASAGGKLAKLGDAVLGAAAKKYIDTFLDGIAGHLDPTPVASPESVTSPEPVVSPEPAATDEPAVKQPEPAATAEQDIDAPKEGGEEHHGIVDTVVETVTEAEHAVVEAVVETEHQVELAAGRGFLGGPMMWGWLALAAAILALIILG